MRREDLQLRSAARRGDAQACLDMALRLFVGDGFPRNPRLGLAYLQQELANGSRPALHLVARHLPLEILVAQQLRPALAFSAGQGCRAATLKLGIWDAMEGHTRAGAVALLSSAGVAPGGALDHPEALARLLAAHDALLDPGATAVACAQRALHEGRLADACRCIHTATAFLRVDDLSALVCEAVRLAHGGAGELALPPALVEAALQRQSRDGHLDAQHALGCALAGLPYGRLAPAQICRQRSVSRGAALLLRAGDGGKADAWLGLLSLGTGSRGAWATHEAARFFLEKAASAGVAQARTRLGVLLLAEATGLRDAEQAMEWLWAASEAGDAAARGVLDTLVLPIPPLHAEDEALAKIDSLDPELGIRMRLARALHLTRHEALSFHGLRDLRCWGVVLSGSSKHNPKGRIAPAAGAAMRTELQRARQYYAGSSPLQDNLVLQRGRIQRRVFELLGLQESLFFAAGIGRSWTRRGWGRHWAGQLPASLQPSCLRLSSTP